MLSFTTWLNESMIPIYQGRSSYNRGTRYWTTDREWARQFTQSGRDTEIKASKIDSDKIYKMDPLPSASSEADFDRAIALAKQNGFGAVWFDEGTREPNSIYVINRLLLR